MITGNTIRTSNDDSCSGCYSYELTHNDLMQPACKHMLGYFVKF